MSIISVYQRIDGHKGKKLFSCRLKCGGTCDHIACDSNTEHDTKLCSQHLMLVYNVAIRPSSIPNAGLGLFCGPRGFKAGDKIAPYGGRMISQSRLNRLYDYTYDNRRVINAAPYAIQSARNGYVLDAICDRRAGAYVNDIRNSNQTVNALLNADGFVYAIQAIIPNQEILVDYGEAYWSGLDGIMVCTEDI